MLFWCKGGSFLFWKMYDDLKINKWYVISVFFIEICEIIESFVCGFLLEIIYRLIIYYLCFVSLWNGEILIIW